MGDADRRADRPTRVKSTVEELRRMRAMLSEQQAEMRTMKQELAEMRTTKEKLAEMMTMKQDHQDEIAALKQELLDVKAATHGQGGANYEAPQPPELKQLQAGACVTSLYD